MTVDRKRLWNVHIALINELDRICKKHNLRWFAGDGTLLGAVRHKGFIPWDNDVDIVMLRPDYEKFISVAINELPDYYFLEVWSDFILESEGGTDTPENLKQHLQFVSQQDIQKGCWSVDWPKLRLRDKRTSMFTRPKYIQGIFIDIFPLDSVPPFSSQEQAINFEVSRELLVAAMYPAWIDHAIEHKQRLLVSYEELKKFLTLPFHQRGRLAEEFSLKTFTDSEYVSRTIHYIHFRDSGEPWYPPYKLEWFKDVVYLPFESIQVPAPIGYDGFLKSCYGDWHVPVIDPHHVSMANISVDIPYEDYEMSVFGNR